MTFNHLNTKVVFTLYQIVKQSIAENVLDIVSVHTKNAAFKAVAALEQYCSTSLLKVKRSVLDRFLKWSESSLNTCIRAEIATEPLLVNGLFKSKGSIANCMTDRVSAHTGNASEQFLHRSRTITLVHTVPEQLLKWGKNLSNSV